MMLRCFSLSISPSSPVTEHENNNKVIVNCSVLTHAHCRHTVEWLHEGKNKISDVDIKPGSCSVTVTFKRSHRDQKSQFYNSLKCKVTDKHTKEEKLFPFKLKSSGEKTGEIIFKSLHSDEQTCLTDMIINFSGTLHYLLL